MYCQKCGAQLPEGTQFCSACGQQVGVPVAPVAVAAATGNPQFAPATAGTRFVNSLIDGIFAIIAGIVIGVIIGLASGPSSHHGDGLSFIGWVIMIVYYLVCESLWQRTPAKFITGTKVVRRDGGKPTFTQILGRTFSRIIPFEAFSFLTNKYPIGWHDSLSNTLVVPNEYTVENVQAINYEELKKHKTSVWLIIVIIVFGGLMIIGILASIVLVSLGTARQKAVDAQVNGMLSSLHASAQMYAADNDDSYTGFCSSPEAKMVLQPNTPGATVRESVCNDSDSAWAASIATASENSFYCTDSTVHTMHASRQLNRESEMSCDNLPVYSDTADSYK